MTSEMSGQKLAPVGVRDERGCHNGLGPRDWIKECVRLHGDYQPLMPRGAGRDNKCLMALIIYVTYT